MGRWLLSLSLLLVSYSLAAQHGNVWIFGRNNLLDFNTSPPNVEVSAMSLLNQEQELEGTASISDSLGRLLFYSDGVRLWDWNHEVITDTLKGHQSSTHAAYIVPQPGSQSQYYLFTLDAGRNQLQNGLRYSVVTACREEGVTVRDVNTLLSGNMTEKMVAVRHANGQDYWLVTHEFGNDQFKVFLIGPEGIQPALIQALGTTHLNPFIPSSHDPAVGAIKASPNGELIALAVTNQPTVCEIFGFNKSSGELNHLATFAPDTLSGFNKQVYGVSFSRSSEFLYLSQSSSFKVWQFKTNHLLNNDVQGFLHSRSLVYSSENNASNPIPSFQHIQLGPDGKIYLVNLYNRYMAVIHEPDMEGAACNFEDSALVLLNPADYGLPSFIDSYDYNISGFCNPNGLEEAEQSRGLYLYPNPATHTVLFKVPGSTPHGRDREYRVERLVISDMLGNTVMNLKPETLNLELDISGLANGIYTVAAQLVPFDSAQGDIVLRARLVVGR